MLKKTITYEDFDGEMRKEDFYFNLTEQEIMDANLGIEGGYDKLIDTIIQTKDTKKLAELFKSLILASYGVKSQDGRKFIKNAEVVEDFAATQAFSDLYMLLATDADEAIKFFKGIMPKKIASNADKITKADIEANLAISQDPKIE